MELILVNITVTICPSHSYSSLQPYCGTSYSDDNISQAYWVRLFCIFYRLCRGVLSLPFLKIAVLNQAEISFFVEFCSCDALRSMLIIFFISCKNSDFQFLSFVVLIWPSKRMYTDEVVMSVVECLLKRDCYHILQRKIVWQQSNSRITVY